MCGARNTRRGMNETEQSLRAEQPVEERCFSAARKTLR